MSNSEKEIGKIHDTEKNVAKKIVKNSFKFLLVIIMTISLVLILLVSFIKLIKFDDTADSKGDKNTKRWESVGGTTKKKATTLSGRGGTVIEKAIEIHKYVRENGFTYGWDHYEVSEFIEKGSKHVDCAGFVGRVLYEVGYDSFASYELNYDTSHHELKQVPTNEVQPGDIVVIAGEHVEIAAAVENGVVTLVYNCGGKNSIESAGTNEYPEACSPANSNYDVVLRVP